MARGGVRAGSGRKPGSPNRISEAVRYRMAKEGELPLEYMLKVMRNPRAPTARRDEMAKAAAPYLHARLAAIEVSGEVTHRPLQNVPTDELKQRLLQRNLPDNVLSNDIPPERRTRH